VIVKLSQIIKNVKNIEPELMRFLNMESFSLFEIHPINEEENLE
jgi:hypothetical protein